MQAIFVTKSTFSQNDLYTGGMHPGGRPTENPRSPLGKRLIKARERAGISQVELAKQLGTNQQTIAYWERKAVSLRSDVIIRLSKILDISADELLGTDKQRKKTSKPTGKAGLFFDAVSKLPRRQQEKVFDVIEPFIRDHSKAS